MPLAPTGDAPQFRFTPYAPLVAQALDLGAEQLPEPRNERSRERRGHKHKRTERFEQTQHLECRGACAEDTTAVLLDGIKVKLIEHEV